MKNTGLKFFIDTTVAVSAVTGRNKDAWVLLECGRRELISLYVNEFVIKEIRRTLENLQLSQERINYAVDYVLKCCTVRKNISKTMISKYDIRDKNDRPILAGTMHESAILVTEDAVLKEDAEKYVVCIAPKEALQRIK